jgi:hypothetical protein
VSKLFVCVFDGIGCLDGMGMLFRTAEVDSKEIMHVGS